MDADRYQKVKALFIEAAELSPAERDEFIDRACGDQRELVAELRSLLSHHDSRTLLPIEKPAKTRTESTTLSRWTARLLQPWTGGLQPWKRAPWLTVVTVLGLSASLAVSGWIYWTLRDSQLKRESAQLQTYCRAAAAAVTQVIERDLWIAQACGFDPVIGQAVRAAEELGDESQQRVGVGNRRQETEIVRQVLEAFWGPGVQFEVLNRATERIMSSTEDLESEDPFVAKSVKLLVAAVIDGAAIARLPGADAGNPPPSTPESRSLQVEFLVPVRGRQREIVAALLLRATGCDERLQQALDAQQIGTSGIAFVFSESGNVIAKTDLGDAEDSTPPASLSGGQSGTTAIWRREPAEVVAAVNTWRGSDGTPRGLFLHAAASGPPGVDLQSYEIDGRRMAAVAWQWLDAYQFGIAVEIDQSELLETLRALDIGFAVSSCLLIAMFLSFAAILAAIQRRLRASERKRLGPYVLDELLGEGGMGQVYKAHHELLKRPTAVKVLKPEVVSAASVRRFTREVQFASLLQHPNTVDIYDYGQTNDGRFYYAMECLVGISLAELVKTFGRLPPERAVYILQQIGGSLREAHQAGVVHRDIKPQNIMVCVCGGEADVVKVLDFGLVKEIASVGEEGDTTIAEWVGTPRYMSPERVLQPANADPRSDIYSCGAVAYWLLTGREVFDNSNLDALLNDIVMRPPDTMTAVTDVPERLRDLVLRCLAKDPLERPQTMVDFLEALNKRQPEARWTGADAAAWWRVHLPSHWQGVPQPATARRSFVV